MRQSSAPVQAEEEQIEWSPTIEFPGTETKSEHRGNVSDRAAGLQSSKSSLQLTSETEDA